MEYRKRMTRCLMAALVVHLVFLLVPAGCPREHDTLGAAAAERPLLLTLKQPEKPLRLIESGAPTVAPVDPATDLISERDSKAQDMSDVEGTRPAPYVATPSNSDEMRQPKPAEEPAAPQPEEPAKPASKHPPLQESPPKTERPDALAATPQPPAPETEKDLPEDDGRFNVAKAEPVTPSPDDPGRTRGRVDGGVKSMGFLSFEAMQSEFAPYLREVRRRVERKWKALIQLRYSGSSATRAVLDCAIRPDGRLVNVSVVEPGDSASYAGLCKEAIERAGPFPPFPFKVPEMYRNQNLEIRWTFSFL